MFQPSFKLTPTNLSARSSRDGRTNCWGGQRCGRSRQWDLEDTEEPETEEALQLGGFSYPTSHHPSTSNVNSDRHSGRAAQRRPSPSSSEATPARSSAEPKPEPNRVPWPFDSSRWRSSLWDSSTRKPLESSTVQVAEKLGLLDVERARYILVCSSPQSGD